MCAISGSYDTDTLKDLVVLNSYRGQHSWSFCFYDVTRHTLTVSRGMGEVDLDMINIPEGCYGICHTQAPTTEAKDTASVHPATVMDNDKIHALWHNGILKAGAVKALQQRYGEDDKWDTALLLKTVVNTGTPDGIDGTFSCLWFRSYEFGHGELLLFRNEISPMFMDKQLNISSTRFEGATPTPPNAVLRMNFDRHTLIEESRFKTVDCPYYFGVQP